MSCVYIKTYGCQMNEYDSEVIAGILQEEGYELTSELKKADIVLVNTCYVREKVKQKVFSFLGELKKIKKEKPSLILGVGGCLSQKDPEEIKKRAPFVDIIWGTSNFHRLPEFLKIVKKEKKSVVNVEEEDLPHLLPAKRKRKFSVFVPVMRGCNNFCSYCNVPYVRGREKSRPPDVILKEIKDAVSEGCREVVLLGQNVNSYGKDLEGKIDFADLLSEVNRVEGLCRIRFTTSHPKDLSEKLILQMAYLDKVCEHLHLPLQAGSNKILKLMRRCYTREDYLKLVEKVRLFIPDIALTTDIIVGFPGETEKDFEDTLWMLEKVRFDGAFTFAYSPIPGTRAAGFENQVPLEVKKKRLRRLIQFQQKITEEKNRAFVGKEVEVLVEGPSKKDPDILEGRTRHNKIIVFKGEKHLIGELVRVKVEEAGCWALKGRLVEKKEKIFL